MGVIIDTIFIIFHRILKYHFFPYAFMSPKMRYKHAFSPGVLIWDVYEINVLFRNRFETP